MLSLFVVPTGKKKKKKKVCWLVMVIFRIAFRWGLDLWNKF